MQSIYLLMFKNNSCLFKKTVVAIPLKYILYIFSIHYRKHILIQKLSGWDNYLIETMVYVHPMAIQDYN